MNGLELQAANRRAMAMKVRLLPPVCHLNSILDFSLLAHAASKDMYTIGHR